MQQNTVKKNWEGEVTVEVTASFTYEVDELWECETYEEAKQSIEEGLADSLGDAWIGRRFQEKWTSKPYCDDDHCWEFAPKGSAYCVKHLGDST